MEKPLTTSAISSASANTDLMEPIPNTDMDLDFLIDVVDKFLSSAKDSTNGTDMAHGKLSSLDLSAASDPQTSKSLKGVSQAAQMISTQISNHAEDIQKATQAVLSGVGSVHWAASGLLVLVAVLQRVDSIRANKKESVDLLDSMNELAKSVKQLGEHSNLKKEMEEQMQKAIELIVLGANLCFSLTKLRKQRKRDMLKASKKHDDQLAQLRSRVKEMSTVLMTQIQICIDDEVRPVHRRLPERLYPQHAIGIEEQIQKVMEMLECKSEKAAVAVVLYGNGGSGKSTLGNAVYAKLDLTGFKHSKIKLSENIHSNPHIEHLHSSVLQDLTGRKHEVTEFSSERQEYLRGIIEKETIFIFIDNVLIKGDLERLLPVTLLKNPKRLRLLLTTLNRNVCAVLESCGIETHLYPMEVLWCKAAMDILYGKTTVIERESMLSNEIHVVHKIAVMCSSSPLILELIGRYVTASKKKYAAYCKVLEYLENKIPSGLSLESVYDLLFSFKDPKKAAEDAFLDICSFFCGWDWDEVGCIVGQEELEILEERALVKRDPSNKLCVHDMLLVMARNKTEGLRIKTNRELLDALKDEEGIRQMKGIWLLDHNSFGDSIEISADKLELMHASLRILALGDWTRVKGKCNVTFSKLRFFQVGKMANIPFDISRLKELRFLDNTSDKDMDLSPSKIPTKLKMLQLCTEGCCRKTFDFTSQAALKLKDLRTLKLKGYEELLKLPAEIGLFNTLKELDLSGCGVEELPESFISLHALQKLSLRTCRNLKKLPESFGKLQLLQDLDLTLCVNLIHLPKSFGLLRLLKTVHFLGCKHLQELSDSFGSLRSLEECDLLLCVSLKRLPEGFEKLSSLRVLYLQGCDNILPTPR